MREQLLADQQILDRAPHAAVLIDEAYYEFSGITALPLLPRYPNLFVSRTFSKVYGLAAMRCGCLFSQADNMAHVRKAQSPYSVNTLAAMAAEAAIQDTEFVAGYVAEALVARELLRAGLEKLGIQQAASSAKIDQLNNHWRREFQHHQTLLSSHFLQQEQN